MMRSDESSSRVVEIKIDGMTCGHCVQAVSTGLARVPGVSVQRAVIGSARIAAGDEVAIARALAAIAEAGFSAQVATGKEAP